MVLLPAFLDGLARTVSTKKGKKTIGRWRWRERDRKIDD